VLQLRGGKVTLTLLSNQVRSVLLFGVTSIVCLSVFAQLGSLMSSSPLRFKSLLLALLQAS